MSFRQQAVSGRLEGYTAIVTGGAGTIGASTSIRFAREGANVVIAQRSKGPAQRVVDRIEAVGGDAIFVPTDLNDEAEVEALIDETVETFGGVNVVVNNAANLTYDWADSMSRKTFEDVITTNLTGPFRLAQHAYEHMRADGYGRVINIGAIQSRSPLPGAVAYASSKAGIDGLTRSLASEWSGTEGADITANTVMIGPIYQDSDWDDHPDLPIEEANDQVPAEVDMKAATLIGRWGRSREAAALLAFLASSESSFITAAVIPCDGGRRVSRKGKAVDQEEHIPDD